MEVLIKKLELILLTLIFSSCSGDGPEDRPMANTDPDPVVDPPTTPTFDNPMLQKIQGNSIQIDPSMFYSQNISPAQLVADLKMANMQSVHFFMANSWDGTKNDNLLRPKYLTALRDNGISIWLMMLGNCTYGPKILPSEWEMECLTPYPSTSVSFYSFHREEFVEWQVGRVTNIMNNYGNIITGIEYAESYFPEWKTVNSNGFYGDVSPFAREKFTREYVGPSSPVLTFDQIRNNNFVYQKWIEFRAQAVIDFNHAIKKAIKDINPQILFASWGMGERFGTMAEVTEHFGLDMIRIVKEVKPDVMVIQTSSQDWGDASLKPNYIKDYNKFVVALQEANPDVAIGLQSDIVSLAYHNQTIQKRDPEWWLSLCDLSLRSGYYTNMAYEYSLAKQEGIWLSRNLNVGPQTLYKEASLASDVIAEDVQSLALVKEKDSHWKMVYTEHGLGWFYVE